ncbi:MAG TPA: O-antigen ligase family protein [Candidatus Saccharimonadales bacterium]|nr:O-antigen ligase family protein [Candidatus Saccharimonadales bacterium]
MQLLRKYRFTLPRRHTGLAPVSNVKAGLDSGSGAGMTEAGSGYLRRIPYYSALALLVYMPFHVFLSQSLSLLTGGLEYWKIGKDLLLALATLFAICLVFWQRRAERWYMVLVGFIVVYAAIHAVVWLGNPGIYAQSAALGSVYNVRLFCYAILGASSVVLWPKVFVFRTIFIIITGVASVIALLGILQYLLPKDTLTHVGYSLDRGVRPAFFIDDNPAFPRIMSTLRDPNSLGAYLIVPFTALSSWLLRVRPRPSSRQLIVLGLWLLHLTAIYLTFSRSAWLAAMVALAGVLWWQFSSQFVRVARRYWPIVVGVVVLAAGGLFAVRHNALVDGVLTHSTEAQVGNVDSNEYHWLYVRRGIDGIMQKPLGHGPGTAGIVSIHNPGGGLLTENYYVQIGYEVGVVGVAIFIAGTVWIYLRLMRRGDQWGAILLSSFWAYVITNMLLHIWSNEAVAAQWWILAGMALVAATSTTTDSSSRRTLGPNQRKKKVSPA